ncbi:MAG: hypothetical protein ACKOBB_00215 [Acidimicrobiaceae bacterium]
MLSKLEFVHTTEAHKSDLDLWVGFQRRDSSGLIHADVRHLREKREGYAPPALAVGVSLIVGNEDANSAIAEVVEVLDDVIYLRIKADSVPQLGK